MAVAEIKYSKITSSHQSWREYSNTEAASLSML